MVYKDGPETAPDRLISVRPTIPPSATPEPPEGHRTHGRHRNREDPGRDPRRHGLAHHQSAGTAQRHLARDVGGNSERLQRLRRRRGGALGGDDRGRGQGLHRRRRHLAVRQEPLGRRGGGALRPDLARRPSDHHHLPQAGDRDDPRLLHGRRSRHRHDGGPADRRRGIDLRHPSGPARHRLRHPEPDAPGQPGRAVAGQGDPVHRPALHPGAGAGHGSDQPRGAGRGARADRGGDVRRDGDQRPAVDGSLEVHHRPDREAPRRPGR